MTEEEFRRVQWDYIRNKTQCAVDATLAELKRDGWPAMRKLQEARTVDLIPESSDGFDIVDLSVLSLCATSYGAIHIKLLMDEYEERHEPFPMTVEQINESVMYLADRGLMEIKDGNAFLTERGKAMVEHAFAKSFKPIFVA